MFDNSISEITRGIAWISITLYTIVCIYGLLSYKKWPAQNPSKKKDFFWLLYFCLFSTTYAIDSDFFHYKDIVLSTSEILDYGLELVYQYLILAIHNDYLLFRIIIFGVALITYFFILARYKIDKSTGLIILFLLFGGIFSYARSSLAFSLYFLGLSLLFICDDEKSINKSFTSSLGIIFILSSFFFHRSMSIIIALTPIAILKLNKKTVIISIILTPLILVGAKAVLGSFLDLLSVDAVIEQRIGYYNEVETAQSNWKGIIGEICHYGMYVLCFYLISKVFLNKQLRKNISPAMNHLYTAYVAISYTALLAYPLFDGNIIFMHRYLKMTIIPISILLTFLYLNKFISSKSILFVLLFAFFGRYLGFARYIF